MSLLNIFNRLSVISNGIDNVLDFATDELKDAILLPLKLTIAEIQLVLNTVDSAIGKFVPTIDDILFQVKDTIVDSILGPMWDNIAGNSRLLIETLGEVRESIKPVLGTITKVTSNIADKDLPVLGTAIGNVATSVLSNRGIIQQKIEDVVAASTGDLSEKFKTAVGGISTTVSDAINRFPEGIADALGSALGPLAEGLGPVFAEFFRWLKEFGSLEQLSSQGELTGKIQGFLTEIEDQFGFLDFSGIPSTSMTDPAAAAAELDTRRKQIILGMLGFGALGIGVELASLGQLEGVTTVATEMFSALGWTGAAQQIATMQYETKLFIPYQYFLNQRDTPSIPGQSDLTQFLVREVITRQRYNELLAFQGFDTEFQEAYWDAHWVLPGTRQVYEMRNRKVPMPIITLAPDGTQSVEIVNDDAGRNRAVLEYLKVADILEPWRQPLAETSFNVITRVDLRRLYQAGEIDRSEMIERMEFTGFNLPDATLVADAQIAQARTEEVGLALTNLKNDLVQGWITDLEYIAGLEALGIPDRELDFRTADAINDRDLDERNERLSIYRDGFRKEMITVEEYTQFLVDEGLELRRVDLIIAKELIRSGVNVFEET